MPAVLDTNVLLSALISPHGTPDIIYRAWRAGKFDLITCVTQLEELRRASRYPKFKTILQPARVGAMIDHLQRAIVIDRLDLSTEINDPDDAFLIAMSIKGNADYLITGDRCTGLLQKKHVERTRILTPTAFCAEVLG